VYSVVAGVQGYFSASLQSHTNINTHTHSVGLL